MRSFALADDTVMTYLCSTGYDPAAEHTVHPHDPALRLPWPTDLDVVLSDKDQRAPTLAQAAGLSNSLRRAPCRPIAFSELSGVIRVPGTPLSPLNAGAGPQSGDHDGDRVCGA
jgi:dTDP-4-dehydrorhamnose 3,5-epimerase